MVVDKGAAGPVVALDKGADRLTVERRFVSFSGNVRVAEVNANSLVVRFNPMVFTPTNVAGNRAVGDIRIFF